MNLTNTKPFLAGNWKMFKSIPEALDLVQELIQNEQHYADAEVVIIPPYPALSAVKIALKGTRIQLGAQNVFWADEGAYTGEVSSPMLLAAGCSCVVVGHSERRQYFGETNITVNKKIKAALSHGLTPIMCIGESLEQREKGDTIKTVESQITEGLDGLDVDEFELIVIAYEPIWAIGTGVTATPEQAQEVHGFIRSKLTEKYGNEAASCAIILYGGSVKPDNAYTLIKEKDINGALIGGASLKADSFTQIIKEAQRAYKDK